MTTKFAALAGLHRCQRHVRCAGQDAAADRATAAQPDVPVPAFSLRMVCTACGMIGADARPNWSEHRTQLSASVAPRWNHKTFPEFFVQILFGTSIR
jgi:hypothetical protein